MDPESATYMVLSSPVPVSTAMPTGKFSMPAVAGVASMYPAVPAPAKVDTLPEIGSSLLTRCPK